MTTWNPADKASTINLSAGDLTAVQVDIGGNSGGTAGKVRSTEYGVVGQFFEITANVVNTGSPEAVAAVGVASATASLVVPLDNAGALLWFSDGWVLGPGVNTNIGTGWVATDVVGVEYHGATDIRFYKNGTLTYTFTGTPPATNLYAMALLWTAGDQVTANFGATAWAHDPGSVLPWSIDAGSLADRNITYAATLPSITQLAFANSGSGAPPPPTFGTGGFFPDTIAAILAGRTVRADLLVRFDFISGPMWVWQGFGTLVTNDTKVWSGVGQLGRIGDLESAIGATSPQVVFSLSGVDPTLIAHALDGEDEIRNRDVDVYIQFFNEDWGCLDNPYVVWAGIMDAFRIKQTGPDTVTVEVSAETPFTRRSLPPLGNLTDREQQQFFPGDVGLSLIPSLMSKVAIWPVILPGYP